MKPKTADKAEQIREKIKSKKGHIHYLEHRIGNPEPIIKEIERRRLEIEKHQHAIVKLQAILADTPAALAKAREELKSLQSRIPSTAAKDLTVAQMMAKIQKIQEAIERIKNGKAP